MRYYARPAKHLKSFRCNASPALPVIPALAVTRDAHGGYGTKTDDFRNEGRDGGARAVIIWREVYFFKILLLVLSVIESFRQTNWRPFTFAPEAQALLPSPYPRHGSAWDRNVLHSHACKLFILTRPPVPNIFNRPSTADRNARVIQTLPSDMYFANACVIWPERECP